MGGGKKGEETAILAGRLRSLKLTGKNTFGDSEEKKPV